MPGAAMDDAACFLIFETLAATYPHATDPEPFFSSPFQVLVIWCKLRDCRLLCANILP
jgi:hypothetical protein